MTINPCILNYINIILYTTKQLKKGAYLKGRVKYLQIEGFTSSDRSVVVGCQWTACERSTKIYEVSLGRTLFSSAIGRDRFTANYMEALRAIWFDSLSTTIWIFLWTAQILCHVDKPCSLSYQTQITCCLLVCMFPANRIKSRADPILIESFGLHKKILNRFRRFD